jgi:hypothetical protein
VGSDTLSRPQRASTALDWWGALFIAVVGTAWHFVYGWSGDNAAVGLVAPVNESVWEHTKLVAVPSLMWNAMAALRLPQRDRLAWAAFAEACVGPVVMVGGYYLYTAVIDRGWFVMDIALFFLALTAGRLVNHYLRVGSGRVPGTVPSLLLIAGLLAGFALLTVSPPDLPLFQEPPPGFYPP